MWVKCKECNGKKEVIVEGANIRVSCFACRGKGGFEVPKGKTICPDCGGSGRVKLPISLAGFRTMQSCKRCRATGFVSKKSTTFSDKRFQNNEKL